MNWITNNNYTIKRKFNQVKNPLKNYNRLFRNDQKNIILPAENKKTYGAYNNNLNVNIDNMNINNNDSNNIFIYNNMYYQINSSDGLLEQLKTAENMINNSLNTNFILSELSEF